MRFTSLAKRFNTTKSKPADLLSEMYLSEIRAFKPAKISLDLPTTFSAPKAEQPPVESFSFAPPEAAEEANEWPVLPSMLDDKSYYYRIFD